jgi:hypothetical protein
VAQIYPIKGGDTILEPDEARINLIGRICSTGAAAMALKPDGGWINPAGRIYLMGLGYVRPRLAAKPLKFDEKVQLGRIYPTK